jgi:hypothetical protein
MAGSLRLSCLAIIVHLEPVLTPAQSHTIYFEAHVRCANNQTRFINILAEYELENRDLWTSQHIIHAIAILSVC